MTFLEIAMVAVGVVLVPLLAWLFVWGNEGRSRDPGPTGWRIPGDRDDD